MNKTLNEHDNNLGRMPSTILSGIRGVIVDLDGTMLHTAPDFQFAINRMRAELDLAPLSVNTITRFVGKGTDHLVRSALAEDLTAEEAASHFEQALASYMRHYAPINGDYATLYPAVIEGLTIMQAQGMRMACVTNKPIAFALPLLQKKNLASYFEIVYGGDSFPRKKPDPMPLLQVCQDFNLPPQQVVAIGDSSNDTQAARAAGCRALIVPYGYNHGQPVQNADADDIVQTLLDAANLLQPPLLSH